MSGVSPSLYKRSLFFKSQHQTAKVKCPLKIYRSIGKSRWWLSAGGLRRPPQNGLPNMPNREPSGNANLFVKVSSTVQIKSNGVVQSGLRQARDKRVDNSFQTCPLQWQRAELLCPRGCWPTEGWNGDACKPQGLQHCRLALAAAYDIRLVAPYCAIPRDYLSDTPLLHAMGFLVSQHGQLGAMSPPFLSVSRVESMRSVGAKYPPPQRGISVILARYPVKTRRMGAIPPSAILSRKGIVR